MFSVVVSVDAVTICWRSSFGVCWLEDAPEEAEDDDEDVGINGPFIRLIYYFILRFLRKYLILDLSIFATFFRSSYTYIYIWLENIKKRDKQLVRDKTF